MDSHATSGAHVNLPVGSVFLNKYQVVQVAGSGNFARVYECIDIRTKERVAVKILKRGYERDADFECDVLKGVNRCDPQDEEGIVKLVERTEHQGLAVIVFKLKGAPLFRQKMPMRDDDIKQVARDVAGALSFLHFRVKAVHTDLKPENILSELASSSTHTSKRKWSLCDLGSASFYKEGQLDKDLITTRPYRAPEVVMNLGWGFPSDAWSLGCILYELRTGKKLFDCHDDATHLRMMEERLGPIPSHMAMRATGPAARRGISSVSAALGGSRSLHHELRADPQFLSLLTSLLEYDPTKRTRCDAVLSHPFLHSQPSSSAVEAVEQLMRGVTVSKTVSTMNINDENAGRSISSKPIAQQPMSGRFGLSTASSSVNQLPGPHASNKATLTRTGFGSKECASDIPMRPISSSCSQRYGSAFTAASAPCSPLRTSNSAYGSSCSNPSSPRRFGAPLISPAMPAAGLGHHRSSNNMPLSYRLTYL
eukprot:CAMPEP_0176416050 /NCGR_PEP_ID=MMETSP0127-20121128/6136_1 /TAXON_ID=938130 /ORGANISM="Platyophrya macrostoma, Strain WH" /LENGTH=480 /DNA_ID=CAMNT_0017796093 /DNA_START=13 /DNA_END=1455 /DNA_ORIENTATION=+